VIPFNKPPYIGNEDAFVLESIHSSKMSGDGQFTQKCHQWFEEKLNCKKALLTTSCTHALEMSAILLGIKEGDEVIMPSYTFVSTANAFVLRGAKIVFVDVRPDTMNIDETKIEAAITDKTKVIVPVHYAGVACEMDTILAIANKHQLFVVEDAAQAMMSTYKGRELGTLGDIGVYSFHETKNFTSAGEGGLLIINRDDLSERAEIIREKGTNRSQFFRGMTDKYSWVDIGSSYLPNDPSAAYLWGQLQNSEQITADRMNSWNNYYQGLIELKEKRLIALPTIPVECEHNAHMFYIKVKSLNVRTELLNYFKKNDVLAVFHYVPLHSALAGIEFGRFHGNDEFTTNDSNELVRLPIYYGMNSEDQSKIVKLVFDFFESDHE